MKKTITIIIVVSLVVISVYLLFPKIPSCDLEILTKKFNLCYTGIESITNKYKLENKVWVTDEAKSLKKYYISITDKARIDIEFSTTATETQKGIGVFSVSYTISDVSEDNNFDVELFTEIVNSASGRSITTDFVTDFLTAPEEKYSIEKYGLPDDGYAVEKMHALNFWEDWFIGYNLTYDNHAEIWFYGYIK